MPSATRLPDIPAPAHTDADGPWWDAEEMSHWWVRENGKRFEARHKHGYLADVTAPSLYLLAVFTWQAQMRHVWRQRETSAA